MDLGWVRTAADFYRLAAEKIVSPDRLREAVGGEARRRDRGFQAPAVRSRALRPRHRGGGIRDGSQPRAALPRRSMPCSRRRLRRLRQAQGVGPKMAATIREQLPRRADGSTGRETCARLGLRLVDEGPAPGQGPLAGKSFVLTGTLPALTREQATEPIVAAGGQGDGSVSPQDRLSRGGREPGLQARPSRTARRVRDRRAGVARAPRRQA